MPVQVSAGQRPRGVVGVLGVVALSGLGLAGLIGSPAAVASPVDPGLPGGTQVAFCSVPRLVAGSPPAGLGSRSFVVCGVGAREFIVPPGVHDLRVVATGAAGGSGRGGSLGGRGERVTASLMVSPGQVLEVAAGGHGLSSETGGFNGGGNGPASGSGVPATAAMSGGGGGGTDIRVGTTGAWTRVVVAAGGGGGGGAARTDGGAGGAAGRPGTTAPYLLGGAGGQPATSAGEGAGGAGAYPGGAGDLVGLIGGSGGIGASSAGTVTGGDGGGGGGGYGFGGGGGGGESANPDGSGPGGGGGGGGGSSYVNPVVLQPGIPVAEQTATGRGNGSVVISYPTPPPVTCGEVITASTTLTRDLDCRNSTGLVLSGPGTVLDLGGHTLYGPTTTGAPTSVGVDITGPGTVRDGTIHGFTHGVHLTGDSATVYQVTITATTGDPITQD